MEEQGEYTERPIACEVCGRRDETVRYVIYPFVFSIVVMTFQRILGGRLCRRHRMVKWLQASLITSLFGWIGIPFGFFMTPVRLFQLAQGGIQNKTDNAQLLTGLADYYLQKGDYQKALRCLESSLEYQDNPEVEERIQRIPSTYTDYDSNSNSFLRGLVLFAVPVLMGILGLITGLVDFGIGWLSGTLFGTSSLSIFIIILFWAPLIAMIFYAISFLRYLLDWMIRFTKLFSTFVAVLLSLLSIFTFVSWIFIGETLGDFITYMVFGYETSTSIELLSDIFAILARGGFYFPVFAINSGQLWGTIIVVIMLVSIFFALAILLPITIRASKHQKLLMRLRTTENDENRSFLNGIVVVFLWLAITIFSISATPQESGIDLLDYYHHLDYGANSLNAGETQQALTEFKTAISIKPNFYSAHYLNGITHYGTGNYTDAETEFKQVLEIFPMHSGAYSYLGFIHLQANEIDLAEQEFNTSLEILPQDNFDARVGLARIHAIRDPQQGITEYLSITEDFPENEFVYLGLGIAYYSTHNFEEALNNLQSALKLDSELLDAHLASGKIYLDQEDYVASKASYEKALKISPDLFEATIGLCYISFYQKDYTTALTCVDDVISKEPDVVDVYLLKGLILSLEGEYDSALSVLKKATPYDEALASLYQSIVYYKMEMPEKANVILDKTIPKLDLIEDANRRAGVYVIAGGIYTYAGKYSLAEQYFLKAKEESVTGFDGNTLINFANILSKEGKYSQAETALKQAEEIGHSDLELTLAKGRMLIVQGKLKEALDQARPALKAFPESSELHAMLSQIYFLQNESDNAEKEANQALRYDAYDSLAYMNLAFIYKSQGKTDEAQKAAKKSVHLDTNYALAHFILGVCYMDENMNDGAISEFQKFMELYRDSIMMRPFKEQADEYLAMLQGDSVSP